MATHTDDLNRADSGTQIGNQLSWVQEAGVFGTFGNAGYKVSTDGAHEVCRADAALDTADHYAQCTVTTASDTKFCGPAVRMTPGANTGYAAAQFAGDAYIVRIENGVQQTPIVASAPHTWVSGQLWRIEANGTTLSLYVAGVFVCSGTDSALAGNLYAGLYANGNNVTFDDFECGDLGGGGGATTSGNLLLLGVG